MLLNIKSPPAATHQMRPVLAAETPASAAAHAPPNPVLPFKCARWVLAYDAQTLRATLKRMLNEPVLGLDVEWRPSYQKGAPENKIALIQLSSPTLCVLVPTTRAPRLLPELVAILASPHIYKCGCGIEEDARKLRRDFKVEVAAILDVGIAGAGLQQAGQLSFPHLDPDESVSIGLKALASACGKTLNKSKSIACSNWERRPLSMQQQQYAAQDAYVGLWIAQCLHHLHTEQHAAAEESLPAWLEQQAEFVRQVRERQQEEKRARMLDKADRWQKSQKRKKPSTFSAAIAAVSVMA